MSSAPIPTLDWPSAFLAFSALCGETVDASARAIAGCETPASRALERELASASKVARAKAAARVATRVVAGVAATPLRARSRRA